MVLYGVVVNSRFQVVVNGSRCHGGFIVEEKVDVRRWISRLLCFEKGEYLCVWLLMKSLRGNMSFHVV